MTTKGQLHRLVDGLSEREVQSELQRLTRRREVVKQGDETIARMRGAFADVDPLEIEAEAVKAVREVRHEMASARAGTPPE